MGEEDSGSVLVDWEKELRVSRLEKTERHLGCLTPGLQLLEGWYRVDNQTTLYLSGLEDKNK